MNFLSVIEIVCGCGYVLTHTPESADIKKLTCPQCGKEYDFEDSDDDFDGGNPIGDKNSGSWGEKLKKVWEDVVDSLKPKGEPLPA